MNAQRKQSGMTFNELIISVAVIVIMLGLSAPSYSGFMNKRKVAGAANMVGVFFENAKIESIKRSSFLTVSYKASVDGTSWCLGAVLSQNVPCDCMEAPAQCQIDSVPSVLSNLTYKDFDQIKTSSANDSVTFDPIRGIFLDPSDAVLIAVEDVDGVYGVNVTVNATGSVRKCTPSDKKLLGYETCI